MNRLEKIVYGIDLLCAFAYGFVTPLLTPKEVFREEIAALSDRPFIAVMVVVCAAMASAVAMYVIVRATTNQSTIVLLLVKLFMIGLPAVAVGIVVSVVLGLLGVYEMTHSFALFIFSAATWSCGGIGGIAAMHSIPEYKQLLKTTRSQSSKGD